MILENRHVRLASCRYGPMLYLPADRYIGRSLDYYGEFSEEETHFLRSCVPPEATVLDLGANHGAHTIPLAQIAKTVYAVEPQRILFQILCANVALNALTNVYTYHAAVGQTPGIINVPAFDYTKSDNFGGLSLGGEGGESVPVVTIDSWRLPACHLIKLDVEGMEEEAIVGAMNTIRQHRPILYLENDRPEKSAALIAQLFALGYRLHWHLPHYFNRYNYFRVTENIYGNTISINMVGVPKDQPQPYGLREVRTPQDTWR